MIATYVAGFAILAAIVGVVRRLRGTPERPSDGVRVYGRVALAGIVLANAIPHFVHGVSGEYFPAPFFHQLGPGAALDVVNVAWGALNFAAGVNLARTFWNKPSPRRFRIALASGFVAMSVFLAIVFSGQAFKLR
ncbi:MAG TPA: hypothetical protein VGL61_24855 [Kofleriaceae bacterium]|jgi:uncharacterized membrane protein HdeD (DUF308 family)